MENNCNRYIKGQIAWLKKHAEYKNGVWVCKKTSVPITNSTIGRSMGCGEVVRVNHLHCTNCEPNFNVETGDPIDQDLVEEIPYEVEA